MSKLFRIYEDYECGEDGYPRAWHKGKSDVAPSSIKDIVRLESGNRCVRCGHPYVKGAGEWSPCDEYCAHGGPTITRLEEGWIDFGVGDKPSDLPAGTFAQWRILTVHHLNGNKRDCRWWNLVALCQRCHLTIQGKVKMDRPYDRQHSAWFIPYVAGFYAAKYLGEDLTPEEALARADELLALEFRQDALFPEPAELTEKSE